MTYAAQSRPRTWDAYVLVVMVALAPHLWGTPMGAKPAARASAAQKPIVFASSSPRYFKLALTEDGQKTIMLAFDEAGGTGKGYDTLYVINASGSNTAPRYISFDAIRKSDVSGDIWTFNPVQLPVVLKPGIKGGKIPFKLDLAYARDKMVVEARNRYSKESEAPEKKEKFIFGATIVAESKNTWSYRISGELKPLESTNELEAVYFLRSPLGMKISSSRPNNEEKPVGIGVDFMLGEYSLECSRDGQPVLVNFSIKTTNEVCVVEETVPSNKLAFRMVERAGHTTVPTRHGSRVVSTRGATSLAGYFVRVLPNTYLLEVKLDLGPLFGIVTLSKETDL